MVTAQQWLAVSALIGECQSLSDSGSLNPSQKASMRCLLAHTQNALDATTLREDVTVNHGEMRLARGQP